MKRSTAISNVNKIADRIKNVCGIIGTPDSEYEAYKVRRAWVFGSTVKGSLNPNDVDIVLDGCEVGLRACCKGNSFESNSRTTAKTDKR